MESSCVEILKTKRGNTCIVVDNYQLRRYREKEDIIIWVCLKEKKEKCKGRVKTTKQFEVVSKIPHTCVPNVAEIEVKKIMEKCKKRVREDVSVPVNKIFQEEMSEINMRGYDIVSETPSYENVKTSLCRQRRAVLGTTQNPADSKDILFKSEALLLSNSESFLCLDFLNDMGKRILVFAGAHAKEFLSSGEIFFLDGTFQSCPKQFSQLYTIHVENGSTETETHVYPAIFALLPDKRETTYRALFQNLKKWCSVWRPSTIKIDFETSAINACRVEFPDASISGCNFHFHQCLWRKIQELGLVVEYKDCEAIRTFCRMCAALSHLPIENIEDAWLLIMENAPSNEKLSSFIDYFVTQWMDNSKLPLEVWNVHGQRHRTNNVVEGWNSKLNREIGKTKPNVYFLVQTLKRMSESVSFELKARELGQIGVKRRKVYINLDNRIKNIMSEFNKTKNLRKCLNFLSYVIKFQ